jgi:hypothetical protein
MEYGGMKMQEYILLKSVHACLIEACLYLILRGSDSVVERWKEAAGGMGGKSSHGLV